MSEAPKPRRVKDISFNAQTGVIHFGGMEVTSDRVMGVVTELGDLALTAPDAKNNRYMNLVSADENSQVAFRDMSLPHDQHGYTGIQLTMPEEGYSVADMKNIAYTMKVTQGFLIDPVKKHQEEQAARVAALGA